MHHAAPGPNPLQLQAISRYAACRNAAIRDERKSNGVQEALSSNLNTRTKMWRQNRCLLRKARLYRAFLLPKRRFFSVPKHRCKFPAGTVPSPGGLRPGAKRGLTNRRSGGRVRVIQKPMSKRSTRRGAFQRAAGGGMAAGEAAANGLYEGGEKAITACNTRRHLRPLSRRSA